jgi:hypothetical protein
MRPGDGANGSAAMMVSIWKDRVLLHSMKVSALMAEMNQPRRRLAKSAEGDRRGRTGRYPRVDQMGCAKVRTNSYSVPLKAGSLVEARVSSTAVEFRHDGKPIASHARCYRRQQKILDLEHYLDVLERKPGALRGSTPLAQWRAQGRWPISYDRIWQRLIERQGRQPGTRAMVELIRLGREAGYGKLTVAIEQALDLGCADVAAIRHLTMSDQPRHTVGKAVDLSSLATYERPLPTMIEYDRLFSANMQAVQA